MFCESNASLGIRPEIFNKIETSSISTTVDMVTDGIPTYATLDVLIAYITAPNNINYETANELLMVYRSFCSAVELWQLLASRILWAAELALNNGSGSETGNNVGIRCFVLMRMWFRDYFKQDFLPDIELRSLVAESLTVLSACTEFVLSDHFSLIMSQLRVVWDSQIDTYWVIPPGILGNVEAPVPMGGEPLKMLNDVCDTPSFVLDGSIPIDADIAVPCISSTPRKSKPKHKISMLFSRKSSRKEKPEEVILHNKVDFLAMKIINEYHERDRRNTNKLQQTLREISGGHPLNNIFNHPEMMDSCTISSPRNEGSVPFFSQQPERKASLHEGDITPVDPSIRQDQSIENDPPSLISNFPRPMIYSGSHSTPILPSAPMAHSRHDTSLSPSQKFGSFNTPRPLGYDNLKQDSSSLRSNSVKSHTSHALKPTHSGYTLDGETTDEGINCHLNPLLDDDDDDEEVGWAGSVRFSEQLQSDQLQGLPDESSRAMSHEQSSDTLNVNNMILANTTGDSIFEEYILNKKDTTSDNDLSDDGDVDETKESKRDKDGDNISNKSEPHNPKNGSNSTLQGVGSQIQPDPIVDDWNALNYDEIDSISFVGSSLSTLSSRSAFSAHAMSVRRNERSIGDVQTHKSHSSKSSASISLMSEVENSLLQPCEGYTPMDAARLRALPDTKLEGDALLATLNKLEGLTPEVDIMERFKNSADGSDVPEFIRRQNRSSIVVRDVMGLGISTNDGLIQTELPGSTSIQKAEHPYSGQPDEQKFEMKNSDIKFNGAEPRTESLHSIQIPSREPCETPSFDVDEIETPDLSKFSPVKFPVQSPPAMSKSDTFHPLRGMLSMESYPPRSPTSLFNQQSEFSPTLPTLHIGLPGSTHAPFVLSYEARAVAEQMTLIEKEISKMLTARELVQVNQPHIRSNNISSWLQVVMGDPPLKGLALVLARFDLVYKWAQSEVILCPTAALQAQTVSRFIQIAFESLRLQNFATMTQLVLALSSNEVQSKLSAEYANLLPEGDCHTLNLLQNLAGSETNHSNLRNAHKRYSWNKGCVPYTPMFVNDIADISKSLNSNTGNEIHFGKYREIAKIAESLLKCVESCDMYNIEPDYALISKCLHIASV